MSSEPVHRALEEAHTDPFLPRITDDLLPPLERPHIPVLDDDSLADLIAALDDPDAAPTVPAQRNVRPTWPTSDPGRAAATPARRTEPRSRRTQQPLPEPEDEPRTFGPDDDPSTLRESADGPVLRCRHGDFRPPVPIGRRSRHAPADDWYLPDAPSLTGLGLTRRSWSRRGSRLFHWTFLAIFLLIALQLVVGLITTAAGP